MRFRCTCEARVEVVDVVPVALFNCKVCRIEAHSPPGGSNEPCDAAGAFVQLHPYSARAFYWVLKLLGFENCKILIPEYGKSRLCVSEGALQPSE